MKINYKTPTFSSFALFTFAFIGIFLVVFFFLFEIQEPEYLIYFAPIVGLLFYGSYYIINNKLDISFLNGAYTEDSKES